MLFVHKYMYLLGHICVQENYNKTNQTQICTMVVTVLDINLN